MAAAAPEAGPYDSLKALGRTAVDIVHTRFELLVTEIAEEQNRLAELLLYATLALMCVFLALVIVAVFVVASLWETPYRMLATGVVSVLLIASALAFATVFARKARAKPRLFSTSLGELGADLERLR